MSLEIWPPVPVAELKIKEAESQERELRWAVDHTLRVCKELLNGLKECYALLAPEGPGSTLVVTTPGFERVKGTMKRVGTRIVKSSINLQLQTQPLQTLSIAPQRALQVHALDALDSHLRDSIDRISHILDQTSDDPAQIASTLSHVYDALSASAAILKGPSPTLQDPSWQTWSCPPDKFSPPLSPNLSLYFGVRDCSISLTIRALEQVDAPVHIGTRLGLAIGTVRRLEHDEMDTTFHWNPAGSETDPSRLADKRQYSDVWPSGEAGSGDVRRASHSQGTWEEVYVREKLRVESADPCLISVYSKVTFLAHMLGQARHNLGAVMEGS